MVKLRSKAGVTVSTTEAVALALLRQGYMRVTVEVQPEQVDDKQPERRPRPRRKKADD